ncbi:MAG: UDP-N-acetylglucosamine 2-epimerase [bacterium]|nr:UDP-N-acetylglucosamine 2-epimerase [bacterium]
MKLLFIPSSGLHVKLFLPIIEKLKDNSRFETSFISIDSFEGGDAEKEFNLNNISFKRFEDYSDSGLKVKLWKALRNLFLGREGIKYPPRYLKAILRNLLKIEKPSAVVVGNDNIRSLRFIIQLCRELKIPTFLLQDGFIIPGKVQISKVEMFSRRFEMVFGKYPEPCFYGNGGTDYILVWGDYLKDGLVRKGINPEKIKVVGSTKIHYLLQLTDEDNRKYLQNINLPTDKPYILFTTTPIAPFGPGTLEELELTLFSIYKNVKAFPEYNFVIKLHPRDKIELYKQIIPDEYHSCFYFFQEENIYNLIKGCSILITETSTTALEAMALNKRILLLNLNKRKLKNDSVEKAYLESNAVMYSDNPHDYKEKLKAALNPEENPEINKNMKKYLDHNLFIGKEEAADRIIEIFSSVLWK